MRSGATIRQVEWHLVHGRAQRSEAPEAVPPS